MKVIAQKEFTGHAGAIYDSCIGSNSGKIYTTSADKYCTRWDIASGEQDQFAIQLPNAGYTLCISKEENHLAIGNNKGGIHFIDLQQKKELRYMTQHQSAVFSLCFNAKHNEFYSGDADGYFCVWDGTTFDLKLCLPLHCGKIRRLVLNEQKDKLVIGGQYGSIRIMETTFFNELENWKGHSSGTNCSLLLEDYLISGGKDAHINVWNIQNSSLLQSIPAHNYAVYDLLYFPTHQLVVSASFDKTIKIWNWLNNKLQLIQRLERKHGGHTHVVNRLVKITEHQFASVGDDRRIILWNIEP